MATAFEALLSDAREIVERRMDEVSRASAERQKIAERLAQIENIVAAAKALPERLSRLADIYQRGAEYLCPSCFLEGRGTNAMLAVVSEEPESFDAFRCGACDHYTTIPLRDFGSPSGGWEPPV